MEVSLAANIHVQFRPVFLTTSIFLSENNNIYLMLLGLQAVLSLNQDRKSPLLCENKMVFPLDEQPYVVMEEYFKARIGQKTVSKLTLSYFLWENQMKSCAYLPYIILRLFASLLLALFVCRNDKKTSFWMGKGGSDTLQDLS